MTAKIKVWGCGKTKEQRTFKTKQGKPFVDIDQSVSCRYSNIVPEGNEDEDTEEVLLEIDPEELEAEDSEERPQDLKEPVLNEAKTGKAQSSGLNQQKPRDREMEEIRTAFKRFLD